jgi:hypothetical protein
MMPGLKELSFENGRRLRAAEGWLGLGDAASAADELKEITPEEQTHPAVLEVRYAIHVKREEWDLATEMAEELATGLPDDAGSWIKLAYATRLVGGAI